MRRSRLWEIATFAIVLITVAPAGGAGRSLTAERLSTAPDLDGSAADPAWEEADRITVRDARSGQEVELRAGTHGTVLYFLVRFPDPRADLLHKPWVWDPELESYLLGPQREDGFTFKWSMEPRPVDLSNFSDARYTADVWYWKANRTNPAGYADDKSHVLADEAGKKAHELLSRSGRTRYLMRLGDAGAPAQRKRIVTDFEGDVVDQFQPAVPAGSRADVRAKGRWADGYWTVEFARTLDTGHPDDVQFDPAAGRRYPFGVSIYGLYGEPTDDSASHLYGQGRISELLELSFR